MGFGSFGLVLDCLSCFGLHLDCVVIGRVLSWVKVVSVWLGFVCLVLDCVGFGLFWFRLLDFVF